MRPVRATPSAVLAALALAACGPSPEERTMDRLEEKCVRQLGGTYASAELALLGGYPVGPRCTAALAPLPADDTCGAASADREVCRVQYYWFSSDPVACQGGACVCELRLVKADLQSLQGGATVCAARFLRGVPPS